MYMDVVSGFAKVIDDSLHPPILWFRGSNDVQYSLIPSLFRTKAKAERDSKINSTYTNLHYAEDIRTQHYIAKNFHLLTTEPSSRVEWLEVMQHHQVNTRVLDWSESSLHALLFSIESFFDKQKYNDVSRRNCRPCVWVLNPKEVNKRIVDYIRDNEDLQENLMKDLRLEKIAKNKIKKNIKRFGKVKLYSETEETSHIDYIFNLSSINDEILRDRNRLEKLLANGDVINPYYYFLSRIYSDGYLLNERKLAPLCVVQPYHSERIKAQRGVFTVFPFYEEKPEDNALRNFGINPDAMEQNSMTKDYLWQIIIQNPQDIALQLMKNGLNDTWLYPEMPVVSSEIENHRIF